MLFSEPKIPQFVTIRLRWPCVHHSFSALQRAENSSMHLGYRGYWCAESVSVLFSEPKIPQYHRHRPSACSRRSFSALQRAENSSIGLGLRPRRVGGSFSALQRAENSSIVQQQPAAHAPSAFQCSSASRKFLNPHAHAQAPGAQSAVSVLFSEPKIPQCYAIRDNARVAVQFQCSSASRKFLNGVQACRRSRPLCGFSALQRAENSSMRAVISMSQ